jgi:GTP1/Obg family GTP-binding protein
MLNPLDELNQIKEDIETAKQEKARAEGRIQSLMKQLKDKYKLDSLEAARKQVKILIRKAERLGPEVETKMSKLREAASKW